MKERWSLTCKTAVSTSTSFKSKSASVWVREGGGELIAGREGEGHIAGREGGAHIEGRERERGGGISSMHADVNTIHIHYRYVYVYMYT